MKNIVAWSVLIVCVCDVSAFAQNKVLFDNQSGEPALVKLIGPTQTEVEVPNGAKAGADAAAGRYVIKVRYGTPGKYHYAKGKEFEVTGPATTKSETTITLHKVVAGNYDSRPISEQEFVEGKPSSRVAVGPSDQSRTRTTSAVPTPDATDDIFPAVVWVSANNGYKTLVFFELIDPAGGPFGMDLGKFGMRVEVDKVKKRFGNPESTQTRDGVVWDRYGAVELGRQGANKSYTWIYAPTDIYKLEPREMGVRVMQELRRGK